MLGQALKLIEEQQATAGAHTLEYGVGEAVAELCRTDRTAARIVAEDLATQRDALKKIAQKMTEAARKKHKGNSYYMGPEESMAIIREHFGLGKAAAPASPERQAAAPLNLLDFM